MEWTVDSRYRTHASRLRRGWFVGVLESLMHTISVQIAAGVVARIQIQLSSRPRAPCHSPAPMPEEVSVRVTKEAVSVRNVLTVGRLVDGLPLDRLEISTKGTEMSGDRSDPVYLTSRDRKGSLEGSASHPLCPGISIPNPP